MFSGSHSCAFEEEIEEEIDEQEAEEQDADEHDSHPPDFGFELKAEETLEETLETKEEIECPTAPAYDDAAPAYDDAVPDELALLAFSCSTPIGCGPACAAGGRGTAIEETDEQEAEAQGVEEQEEQEADLDEADEHETETQEEEEQLSHVFFELQAEETLEARDEIDDPIALDKDGDVPEDTEPQVPLWIWTSAGRVDKSICDQQRGQVV